MAVRNSSLAGMKGFQKTLNKDNFFTADVAMTAGVYTLVGSYTVPAQQIIAVGYNDAVGGASVSGAVAYIRLDSTAGQMAGTIRIYLENATGTRKVLIKEEHTTRWSADSSDRTKGVLLPEQPIYAREDDLIKVEFKTASTQASHLLTVDYDDADTSILLPITVYQ